MPRESHDIGDLRGRWLRLTILNLMATVLWSASLPAAIGGLALAREANLLLVRDASQSLATYNSHGALQARTRLDGLTAAVVSDDGTAIIAGSQGGEVWLLQLDLKPIWKRRISAPVGAVATDMFGQYIAIADTKGMLHLFDKSAQNLGEIECPRPLKFLAFIPQLPQLAAAADFGWVGALDLFKGEWLWNDRPVAHSGGLSVGASANPLALACYSDGVRRYDATGKLRDAIPLPRPAAAVALTFAGDWGIATTLGPEVYRFGSSSSPDVCFAIAKAPVAIVLSALGDTVYAASPDNTIQAIATRRGT